MRRGEFSFQLQSDSRPQSISPSQSPLQSCLIKRTGPRGCETGSRNRPDSKSESKRPLLVFRFSTSTWPTVNSRPQKLLLRLFQIPRFIPRNSNPQLSANQFTPSRSAPAADEAKASDRSARSLDSSEKAITFTLIETSHRTRLVCQSNSLDKVTID